MYRYLAVFLFAISANCYDPEVEIPQGKLIGRIRNNIDGGSFYSFQSVPFGKPPLGDLRFKAPQPAEAWEGTLDATEDLPECIQAATLGGGDITGQEDCLYLNVYTPGLPNENVTNLPVMVFIFGGAFSGGSAVETVYGPDYLLTKDVILVVPNYRVAAFGFLNLDDPSLPFTGNAGLKDQSLALKWVQENIEYFGGNPDNVLIFGQSAGGQSVHLHMLSPLSKGLFKKVIAESGVALKIEAENRDSALNLAEALGVQTEDYAAMMETFQSLNATEIAVAASDIYIRRVIEVPAEGTFIQERPIDIIRSGDYNHAMLMIGFNDAEAKGELEIVEDFTEYIPPEFNIDSESEVAASIAARIKAEYYGDEEPSTDNPGPAIYLETDYGSGFAAFRSAIEHLKNSLYPIYFYFFSMDTTLNYSYLRGRSSFPGAAHMDELSYLFSSSYTPEVIEEGSIEERDIRVMVELWTNFAIYDTPTPEGYDFIVDPVTADQFSYLDISTEETTVKVDPKKATNAILDGTL